MSKQTELYRASARDAASMLDNSDGGTSIGELRAALINALQRIHDLEEQVRRLTPRKP